MSEAISTDMTSSANEDHMKQQNIVQAIAIFVILVVLVIVTVDQTLPPDVLPAEAPATEFSAERAIEHLEVIATEPRLVGSEGYDNAQEYIIHQLTVLGLAPEVQETRNSYPVSNVIARIEGTDNKEAILLVAHLDSVNGSPGATDDGAGVATLLETARALQSGPPLHNTIMFLFNGPEETGAHGATAFINEHPWAEDVQLVINFDAGGLSGPAELTGRSSENGWLIREAGRADPAFQGSSATGEGTSDFTLAFRPAGYSGYDFQYTWDRRTHSELDNLDSLNPNGIQHLGYHGLSLARHFGDLDSLDDPKEPDPIYFNFLRLGTVRYADTWVIPLMLVAVLLFAGIVILGFRRKVLSLIGIGLGLLVFALSAISAPLIVNALWSLLSSRVATYQVTYLGHAPNEMLLLGLFACLTIALVTTWYGLIQKIRPISIADLTISAFVFFAVITVVTAVSSPEASFIYTWPALFGFLGVGYWFLSAKTTSESFSIAQLFVLVFAAVMAIVVMVPDTMGSFMTSEAGDWFFPIIQIVMILGVLITLGTIINRPNKWWLPGAAWLATAVLLIAAFLR